MPYTLDDKLVVGIASSALFDLSESHALFLAQGTEAYRQHQRTHEDNTLPPGMAFPFIKRLLGLNVGKDTPAVEVVLISKNDPDTGLRVSKSIEEHGLGIIRMAFLRGGAPYKYIRAYNVSLFLSADAKDVRDAIMNGLPAGRVLPGTFTDEQHDKQLRIAFDFDGVIIDDEAEKVYREGGLERFRSSEKERAAEPHTPGLLAELLHKIAELQRSELEKAAADDSYEPLVRIAIITSRDAKAMERMVTTLRQWNIIVDETHMLGGLDKRPVLEVFSPHLFFDDQRIHLDHLAGSAPAVHIPFGVGNEAADVITDDPPAERDSK